MSQGLSPSVLCTHSVLGTLEEGWFLQELGTYHRGRKAVGENMPTGTYSGRISTMAYHMFGFIDYRTIKRADEGEMEVGLTRDLMFHRRRCDLFEALEREMDVLFKISPREEHGKKWEAIDVQPAD